MKINDIYSFNNFSNEEFNNYLRIRLKVKGNYLFTSNISAKNFFDYRKIIFCKKPKETYLLKFSSFNNSEVEKFYAIKILINGSLKKKFLVIFKILLDCFRILPKKNFFRKKFYKVFDDNIVFKNLYCDFRSNEIYSNNQINQYAKLQKIKIHSLVFSWDNLFAGDVVDYADRYYVQSSYFKNLLNKRHNISLDRIKKIESFQFRYLKKKSPTRKKNYFIYAFSHSSKEKEYFKEELGNLKLISEILLKENSNIQIIARLYPYDYKIKTSLLKKMRNVKFQKYGKLLKISKNQSFMFENKFNQKNLFIKNCLGCINVFTTFGIEASIANKPTIFFANKNCRNKSDYYNSIYFKLKFMPHYQIIKHKINFIDNAIVLRENIRDIIYTDNQKKFNFQSKLLKKIFLH